MPNKKKTEKNWLKALKETSKHFVLSLILIFITSFITFFIFFLLEPYHASNLTYDLIGMFFQALIFSLFFPLPLLIGIYLSYRIIYSNLKKSMKILFTVLFYLFLGFGVSLFLLIPGVILYPNDKEAGWFIVWGGYLVIPSSLLIILNYIFMYYRNKNGFNKLKK